MWLTTTPVTLQPTDFYPPPGRTLATREHILAPATLAAQQAGCVDGKTTTDGSCIAILQSGVLPTLAPVGNKITDFSLTVVYEAMANGAYFVGELTKFVHVSPQRFESVKVGGQGPSEITVVMYGSSGDVVSLVSVDAKHVVHVKSVMVPIGGVVTVDL